MIRFVMGSGENVIEGSYTPDSGIVITTQRPGVAGLDTMLQDEIDNLMRSSPHAVAGRYAMAIHVLEAWGAVVDTSQMPKQRRSLDY
jgi:hypothetical protein